MSISSSIRKISVYGWQLGEADIQYSNLGGAPSRELTNSKELSQNVIYPLENVQVYNELHEKLMTTEGS